MRNFIKYLTTLFPKDAIIYLNEPLKDHCSFGIGGKAKFYIVVNNINTLKNIINKNKKRFFLLGAGTNILFKDKKFNGVVVKLGKDFQKIKIIKDIGEDVILEVGAGVNLFTLNNFLQINGLSGLEWSFGIPGSVGGATIMNAGAYETNSVILFISENFKENTVWKNNLHFLIEARLSRK